MESELFGHEKGAFTGATSERPGLLEAAEGGTLFIDEMGELSVSVQTRLLRALEDREVLRIGARKPRRIDVRFVAATNRDLAKMVAAGTFRSDLYYRLASVVVRIPPLRERPAEIRPLVTTLLARLAPGREIEVSEEALALLHGWHWPGNIRELRNVVERALVLGRGEPILREHILFDVEGGPAAARAGPSLREEVQSFERARVVEALERAAGNQTRAAELLGVSRRTLVRWLADLDLPRPRK